jgi:methyl acetate hydrolase
VYVNEAMIRGVLEEAIASGGIAGAVVAVTKPDSTLFEIAVGQQSIDAPAAMQVDSVFWIASMTKALTTVAALQLVEREN